MGTTVPSLSLELDPAPGEDAHLALALANSTFLLPQDRRSDLLTTPAGARAWLAAHDLAAVDADVRDLCASRMRALRGHVRSLLDARISGTEPQHEDLAALNVALVSVPTAPVLQHDEQHGWHRAPSHPVTQLVDRALALIAADLAELVAGPDAERLARCGARSCDRFLLRTHARRSWCSTRCGDRMRAARSYARRTHQNDRAQ